MDADDKIALREAIRRIVRRDDNHDPGDEDDHDVLRIRVPLVLRVFDRRRL